MSEEFLSVGALDGAAVEPTVEAPVEEVVEEVVAPEEEVIDGATDGE